tara:strand:+ start:4007 stop:6043 length:2037 start_codon:yes stop_codon:yes gene_type:complete
MNNSKKFTNDLVHESSPYLLQHAHNPVNWKPWKKSVLDQAVAENKPIIVSIGYSACHWCHVMEHESFEDESVAKIMNDHFICIKVDREERPDIDQVYMSAVQLMTGQGGWPLNCITMPDGRPFYGGTYFKKEQWKNVLMQLVALYKDDHKKVVEYAEKLTTGVHNSEIIDKVTSNHEFTVEQLKQTIENWSDTFDPSNGGPNRAPKFMMPNTIEFLLYANYFRPNPIVKDHIELTLEKMAFGGIYDQVGGGFARYSVDQIWKVPHFEKMLYDNAQLISLYSKAYQATNNNLYERIAIETINFVCRELMHKDGFFYSALDADSEGVEGKFYVWTKEELQQLFPDDFEFISLYYHIDSYGYWENNNYILMRNKSEQKIAEHFKISKEVVREKAADINKTLLKERENRTRPGLDDKMLTSWNGLMISALIDAYKAFGESEHLRLALKVANFISDNLLIDDKRLLHSYKNKQATITGFLEDYACISSAFLHLYEVSTDIKWLKISQQLINYCHENFYDHESEMFFFTDKNDAALIARKMEVMDNVIPASNSILANALYKLGKLTTNEKHLNTAKQMLSNVGDQLIQHGSSFSNWGILLLHEIANFYEVAIVGEAYKPIKSELEKTYLPNCVVAISATESNQLPIFEGRFKKGTTAIYVCSNHTCNQPTSSAKDAIKQLQRIK